MSGVQSSHDATLSKIDVQTNFVCTKCKKTIPNGSDYFTNGAECMCAECAEKVAAGYMSKFPHDGAQSAASALAYGGWKYNKVPESDAEKKARWEQKIAKYEQEKSRLESKGTPLDWKDKFNLKNLEFAAGTAKQNLAKAAAPPAPPATPNQ